MRDELTAIALRDWDPAEIDRRVRASQAWRRILVRGEPGPPNPEWEPDDAKVSRELPPAGG